jgi:hypothetical protein
MQSFLRAAAMYESTLRFACHPLIFNSNRSADNHDSAARTSNTPYTIQEIT